MTVHTLSPDFLRILSGSCGPRIELEIEPAPEGIPMPSDGRLYRP
jgi:hypothetical protein